VKIAFSTTGDDLNAPLGSQFGRAPKFLVYDSESESFRVVDNRLSLEAAQGAGVRSAEMVARLGAKVLVTGNSGPKASGVLAAAGIEVYHSDAPTVAEALKQYLSGKLIEVKAGGGDGYGA
jgi:predicted Fe-Mo cluster-binding NifX family protein